MDEEPVPHKIEHKMEDAKEEVKEELQKEMKEEVKEKKGKRIGAIISRIFFTLLFLFIVFETVIGVLDMQRINDNKDPVWCINIEEKNENGKKETIYNLGLYVIVKSKEGNESKITLKPFFLK